MKPNLVIIGAGRSGTTIVARMAERLGWNLPNVQENVAENIDVKDINRQFIERKRQFQVNRARQVIKSWPEPWCIKDPRFKQTLQLWQPLLGDAVLLLIDRPSHAIAFSMKKKGWAKGQETQWARAARNAAIRQFKIWEGPKLRLNYEDLHGAISLFNTDRGFDHWQKKTKAKQ